MGLHFYKTLLRYKHTGSLAENAKASSPVEKIDKPFQVHRAIIFPPYNGGAIENIVATILVDDKSFDPIHLDSRMCPPVVGHSRVLAVPFGNNKSVDPRYNTCLKGIHNLKVELVGGIGGKTGDVEVWLQGDWWEADDAMQDFFGGDTFNPEAVSIVDPFRDHEVTIDRSTKITVDEWKNASAGSIEAPKPRVLPYFTYARNKVATTVNKPYDFDIRLANVENGYEDLYWDMTDKKNAIYLNRIGVLPHANLLRTWLDIGGDEYPKDRWQTEFYTNEIPLPFLPDSSQAYWGPREVGQEMALLVFGERGVIKIVDNGTLIPANGVLLGIWARRIELE